MPSLDASVKPMLKANSQPPKHALWAIVCPLHRCLYLNHRFNRWLGCSHLILVCPEKLSRRGVIVLSVSFGCTDAKASVKPVLLIFLFCSWIDLDLIFSLIDSFFKCCFGFFGLSWAVFERVCKICKANSILVKLLTQEPLLIVRTRTKNYKTRTKSSVIHLLVTLETR